MTDLHKAATMALDIDLVELRLELDELKTDAERLNWLCQDFPSGPEKDQRDEILSRMSVMSLSATRAAIDAARKETSCTEIHKAVLASLDALSDDAAAHIFPSDLQKCMTSECVVQVVSVRAGNPDERTVPLFSREQVDAALREALAAPVVPASFTDDDMKASWLTGFKEAEFQFRGCTEKSGEFPAKTPLSVAPRAAPPKQPSVPPGYALVPIEPTPEMCQSAQKAGFFQSHVPIIWKALLSAAPQPKDKP